MTIHQSITIDAPFYNWGRPTYHWTRYGAVRTEPLPLPGWTLTVYECSGLVDDDYRYVAAAASPSGIICTLIRWVSADYSVSDYLVDDGDPSVTCYTGRLPGIRPIAREPELRVVDTTWTEDAVEEYTEYLGTFGIDCAYPVDESYRDALICFRDDLYDEQGIDLINTTIREWIELIKEAANG